MLTISCISSGDASFFSRDTGVGMTGQGRHDANSPMSSDKDESEDGINGQIKLEPDAHVTATQNSVYADLHKSLPPDNMMHGLAMQNNGVHGHSPVVSLNNGTAPDMGQMLSEYQTLW